MTGLALADYLTDFGAAPAAARTVEVIAISPQPAQPAPVDVGAIVAAEVARAENRLRAELSDATEAALSMERARHEVQVAQMQAAFGAEAGAKIVTAVAEAEARLTSLTSASAARILSTFLSDELVRRSVDQLALRIREAVADRDVVRIKVSGPRSMLDRLEATLGPLAGQCDFSEADAPDVTVSVDGTLFETRLAEWAAQIGETLS